MSDTPDYTYPPTDRRSQVEVLAVKFLNYDHQHYIAGWEEARAAAESLMNLVDAGIIVPRWDDFLDEMDSGFSPYDVLPFVPILNGLNSYRPAGSPLWHLIDREDGWTQLILGNVDHVLAAAKVGTAPHTPHPVPLAELVHLDVLWGVDFPRPGERFTFIAWAMVDDIALLKSDMGSPATLEWLRLSGNLVDLQREDMSTAVHDVVTNLFRAYSRI